MAKAAERAFVAFSGGGAKGIVHVGALKALGDRGIALAGLSGTSAGAIVATLAASGFSADEIINTETGSTIIDELNTVDPRLRRATDLFGLGGWRRIRLFRRLLRQPVPLAILLPALWLAPAAPVALLWTWLPGTGLALGVAIWLIIGVALLIAWRSLAGGLADATAFRDALAVLLQRKLFPQEPSRIVTMADYGRDGRPSLKIVSANLSRGSLQLFSADRTPSVAVADAVAASICLPAIFAPWEIDGELHVDGGIVSNLPAWPFDEERELDPEALTIAIEIDDSSTSQPPTRRNWLPAAVRTALFGSGELNVRVAGPTEQLALPTRLDLLAFDISSSEAASEVRQIARAVGVRLDKRLSRLPTLYRDACALAQALALDLLGMSAGGQGVAPRVRVAVGRLERGYVRSLRMSHSVGFADDPDEAMLIPLEGSVAGRAWLEGESRFEVFRPDEHDLPGPAHRIRRKLRWRDLAWMMCIPILDKESGAPRLLVQIDGNTPLPESPATAAALSTVEEAVKDFFDLILSELKELEDSDGLEKRELRDPQAGSQGAS